MADSLVLIARCNSLLQAQLARAQLAAAGIAAHLPEERGAAVLGEHFTALGGIRVFVARGDAELALELLEASAAAASEPRHPGDATSSGRAARRRSARARQPSDAEAEHSAQPAAASDPAPPAEDTRPARAGKAALAGRRDDPTRERSGREAVALRGRRKDAAPWPARETALPGRPHETALPGRPHEAALPGRPHEAALPGRPHEAALSGRAPDDAVQRCPICRTAQPRRWGHGAGRWVRALLALAPSNAHASCGVCGYRQ